MVVACVKAGAASGLRQRIEQDAVQTSCFSGIALCRRTAGGAPQHLRIASERHKNQFSWVRQALGGQGSPSLAKAGKLRITVPRWMLRTCKDREVILIREVFIRRTNFCNPACKAPLQEVNHTVVLQALQIGWGWTILRRKSF